MREQHVHELMIERGEFTADHNEYYLFDEIDNCDRSADFYHGTSSPYTLCEVKTYKNKRYAIGQLLDYRRLLRKEGQIVKSMRIHLFDVERSGATAEGIAEFRTLCTPLGIEVTREPPSSPYY